MLPQLRRLEREFAPHLVVLGVHSAKFPAEREQANLDAAVHRLGVDHPVVGDPHHALWDQYAVRAWPTVILIDPRGYLLARVEGEFAPEPVRDLLRAAVARFAAAGRLDGAPVAAQPRPGFDTPLRFPGKVLADPVGGRLFVADSGHHRILVADPGGTVRLAIGGPDPGFADGSAAAARFADPQGLALSPDGQTLFVADRANHALRAVSLPEGRVATLAGTGERGFGRRPGAGRETPLASPWDLAWFGDRLWIAMAGAHQLWVFDPRAGTVTPAAGSGAEALHDGALPEAAFAQPSGLAVLGEALYVVDGESSAVRRVSPAENRVRRLIGRGLFAFGDADGTGDQVRLQHPLGICAVDDALYVADTYNHKIKRLDPATRRVEVVFGDGTAGFRDGPAGQARFWEPGGVSALGRRLYVADTNNHAIRVADLDAGTVETVPM